MVIHILQKKILRPKEVKWLIPGGTEKMEQCQLLANCGCAFQRLLCLAQGQGQRHHLSISSRPCPTNPIVHPQVEEFLSGRASGNVWELFSFSHLGWREPLIFRDGDQGFKYRLHAGLPHKVKTSVQIFNSIAVQKHKRTSFPYLKKNTYGVYMYDYI